MFEEKKRYYFSCCGVSKVENNENEVREIVGGLDYYFVKLKGIERFFVEEFYIWFVFWSVFWSLCKEYIVGVVVDVVIGLGERRGYGLFLSIWFRY